MEPSRNGNAAEPVTLTISALVAYCACGSCYQLRTVLGFQPFLAPELATARPLMQYILRAVAEYTVRHGHPPDG